MYKQLKFCELSWNSKIATFTVKFVINCQYDFLDFLELYCTEYTLGTAATRGLCVHVHFSYSTLIMQYVYMLGKWWDKVSHTRAVNVK